MSKRVTTASFIQRAREVHGDRYDYSKAVYTAAKAKITIICPEHGAFQQTPANHCTGHGCHECGGNRPLSLDRFIARANKIHGARYDYSRVVFSNVESKIEIVCPIHGPFFQRLMNHLKGFGCDRCGQLAKRRRLSHTSDRFLEDARLAHGDLYDYSEVDYVNALTKVTIICRKHGPFRQIPSAHIRGIGCARCGDERMAAKISHTIADFVKKSAEVHGARYDYSRVDYKNSHDKVEIVCLVHGPFWQSPANHTKGDTAAGCPGCAASGFDQTKPGLLYYVAIKTDGGETRYKIGITNLTVRRRFPSEDFARMRIVHTWNFEVGRDAADREAAILMQFACSRYFGPAILVGAGNTELFTHDVLGLDRGEGQMVEATVDTDANLINRQIQCDFDF